MDDTTVNVERAGNGFAVTALVLGIIGIVFGMIPLFFWIAIPLGLIGLGMGIGGFFASRRPRGSRRGMSIVGAALSAVALGIGVAGAVIVDEALTDLQTDLEQIERDLERDMREVDAELERELERLDREFAAGG